jgi:hypothetical protein
MLIPSQAIEKSTEGVETRTRSPNVKSRAVKSHERATSQADDDIVRYFAETRRVANKKS